MLMSVFGTKILGLLVLLQDAAATASPEGGTADHFTLTEMVKNMGGVAIAVVIVLLIMSVYSIAIMVERYLTYSAAKKQSREFAPRVAQALKNDRIEEAINNALAEAAKSVHNMDWFEVLETRGHIQDGKVGHFQVTIKVGFRVVGS